MIGERECFRAALGGNQKEGEIWTEGEKRGRDTERYIETERQRYKQNGTETERPRH